VNVAKSERKTQPAALISNQTWICKLQFTFHSFIYPIRWDPVTLEKTLCWGGNRGEEPGCVRHTQEVTVYLDMVTLLLERDQLKLCFHRPSAVPAAQTGTPLG